MSNSISDTNTTSMKNHAIFYGIVALVFIFVLLVFPEDPADFGPLTMIPAAFLLLYVFTTKRILEALFVSSILGYVAVYKAGFLYPFNDMLLETMMDGDVAWLFIVCGLMGSIIALIEKVGGAFAFGEWVAKRATTKKSACIWTWILGCVIFIDDYLNSLTVGSCMAPVTDKYKISREFLSYITDSTAAPVCVLLPVSTWAAFIGSLLEQNGLAGEGEGIAWFIRSIPFNFYGWFAALLVPLVVLGIVPIFGPMKKAEQRAQETGVLAPEGSEKIDIRGGKAVEAHEGAKVMNFILPILVMIYASMAAGYGSLNVFSIDALMSLDLQLGVLITVVFMFFLYIPQKLIDPEEFADTVMDGIKNMLMPLIMVVLAYSFGSASEEVGFIQYCIDLAMANVSPQMLPITVFIVFGITEFIMGLSWGMYIVAIPIVLPLAAAMDVNPAIVIGAVTSAGVFGSHVCFYSDATILTSAATGCNNFRHAITQAPFGLVAAAIAAIGFLITGFMFV